jgi:hypothetical protein
MDEFGKYRISLLKVQMPDGESVWLSPTGPDAMFGAIGLTAIGQPAVCVSCEDAHSETVPEQGHRGVTRTVDVSGELSAEGTLSGEMTMTYNGLRAVVVRTSLRKRTDQSRRKKYIDLMISNLLSGASLQDYEIVGEDTPDEPLVITASFKRQNFAREIKPGTLQVETNLFQEAVASSYAELSTRRTPMAVFYQRDHDYSFHVKLPDGFTPSLRGQGGEWEIKSEWGKFGRSTGIEPGSLSVTATIDMPIQRIAPEKYKEFRQWAIAAERSSLLFLKLQKSN